MSWYLIICSFALLLFTFLHEGTCVCACNMPTCDGEPRTGHAAGRLHTLWILLAAVLSLKRCVPPKPPAPPSSLSTIPPSTLLFLGPSARLWPVDECYILAVSARVCWGLACGGSAASGPVCQLLVPLPPGSQCWLGCSQWHKHAMTDSLWPENERIALRIGIFIAVPMKRRLFQTFKCSGVVFLNKPQKLWQMVYCINRYFISGTFNCHFQTSEE